MSTNDVPVATIKKQSQTNTPVHSDSTIMDDTVMTMNGSALMGGPVTITEEVKSKVETSKLFTKIPRSS